GDRDARPDCYPGLAASPQPNREWLAKGAGVIGDMGGPPERENLVGSHVASERAVDRRRGEEHHVPTEVVVAGAALPAGAAWHARLERDSLPELVPSR